MTTSTLARPGRRPGALVPVALDPRPCVVNPPQWWDVGNDGNAAAMWLCKKRCPLAGTCTPESGVIRQGIAWGGSQYAKTPTALKVCPHCKHPKVRHSNRGATTCKCDDTGRTREQVIQAWMSAGGDTRPIAHIAPEIGMSYHALRDALRRARKAGDRRVPLLKQEAA
ncbi:hypothetical protein [Micromonospora maritima]|uniref:hypothetical protein n=1 Tax=Micromonospora maritima TaxID=986711 RepID=UPI00157CF888|nr:hypothetical protein [Micromonospora maritima]